MLRSIHAAATRLIASLRSIVRYNTLHPILRLALALTAWYSVMWPTASHAQNMQYTKNKADQTLRSGMRVDPSTLGLSIQIPLREYPGRGGSLPIVLNYSSKVWRINYVNTEQDASSNIYTNTEAIYAENSSSGWTSSLGVPSIEWTDQAYTIDGQPLDANASLPPNPIDLYYIHRMHIRMPDGSTHELRKDDTPRNFYQRDPNGTYYAVDGSRMRYVTDSKTLHLPDGSRYVEYPNETKYIDRNGNTLTYAADKWTDTQGRVIGLPPLNNQEAGNYVYKLKGVGGVDANYTFRWRYLEDVRTDPNQPLRYTGDRTYAIPEYSQPLSPSLFNSNTQECVCALGNLFNPIVLYEIELPNGGIYRFTYNVWGEIDKVVLPTGGYERHLYQTIAGVSDIDGIYTEGIRGVTDRWVSADGTGTDEARWRYSSDNIYLPSRAVKFTVTEPSPSGTRTERYVHPAKPTGTYPAFGFEHVIAGMAYDERVYSPAGPMLRRKLTEWVVSGPLSGGWPDATRNPRVTKTVEIILDTGGDALAAATEMIYDADFNVTSTKYYDYRDIEQSTATEDVPTIDNGTPLRTEETTYLVNDTLISSSIRQTYRDRQLLGLPTSTRIKNGVGSIVAKSAISYDESAYPLLTYSSVTGWGDPGTTARGNATTTGTWLNTTDAYLQTHVQYDQCGNIRKIWDAANTSLNNPTQLEYSNVHHYAYLTSTTSADPDLINGGQNGPLPSLTTFTVYDFFTGLVTQQIDANGQSTTFDYNDPLNRVKQVVRASGDSATKNQTTYSHDDPGRTVTVTSDLTAYDDNLLKTQTLYDKLGRPVESRVYETGSSYITSKQEYDALGRVKLSYNPYRTTAESTYGWAESTYDDLSRLKKLESFGLAGTEPVSTGSVTTEYRGAMVLVTDQATKKRLSRSNSLGQLTDVWEIVPTDTSTVTVSFGGPSLTGYLTHYGYNALNDLTTVTQQIGSTGTTQTRTFVYDSLQRLTDATNPESGHVIYDYDPNGNLWHKTDARGVVTTHGYDKLNRAISRTYNDGTTPAVTYAYDAAGVGNFGKGRLTSVSSSVSSYSYSNYDALGRALGGTQTTDGQPFPMSYSYDLAGNMKSQTYPSGRVVTSEFDSAGRLAGVKNQATGAYYAGAIATDSANRFQYSAHGAIKDMKLGNGLWEHAVFNARLQPTEIGLGTAQGGIDRLKLNYDYGTADNNGNVRSQTITVPTVAGVTGFTATQNYTYDALNRLATAQENTGGSWTQNFSYDRYGNRNFAPGTTFPAQLNASNNPVIKSNNNRIDIEASGQTSYSYDGAGNLTHDVDVAGHAFAYDAENKQTTYDGGATVNGGATYYYDGDGQRVKKVVGGPTIVTTVFVYNIAGELVAEYTNTSPSGAGGTSYLTSDTLGSPRVITGPNQEVRARHDYLPFGEELFAGTGGRTADQGYTGDAIRQKFTLKERDIETGLDYFLARYYSSTQGRFTSPDEPFMDQYESNPQSWNLYSYARNNPLRLVDPTGNRAEDSCPECADGPPLTPEEIEEHERQVRDGEIDTVETTVDFCGSCGNGGFWDDGTAIEGMEPPGTFRHNMYAGGWVRRTWSDGVWNAGKMLGMGDLTFWLGGAASRGATSGLVFGARLGPGIAFRSVDDLIAAAGKLKTLKHGEGLGTVRGNAKEILEGLARSYGAEVTTIGSKTSFKSGNLQVTLYGSTSTKLPTLQINRGGVIHKIRVEP